MIRKEVKIWEWVLLGIVLFWIVFHKKALAIVAQMNLNNFHAGKSNNKGSFFRRLIQSVLDELPFGGVLNNVWNELFPPKGVE